MFRQLFLIAAAAVAIAEAGSANLISKICSAEDSKCIKEVANAALPIFVSGLPEFSIESIEPMHIKKIDGSTSTLKLLLKDVTIRGLKGCKIKKIVRDVPKSKMFVRFECNIVADGLYEMKGKILVLPIEGNDKAQLKMNKLNIAVDLDMGEKVGADGKKHWDIKDHKQSFEFKEKSDLVLENLLQGSEVLGRAASELIENHTNEILSEIGPPVVQSVVDVVVKSINKYFSQVPADQLEIV